MIQYTLVIKCKFIYIGVIWHTLVKVVQDLCALVFLPILDCLIDRNVYLDCPSDSFACVLSQDMRLIHMSLNA